MIHARKIFLIFLIYFLFPINVFALNKIDLSASMNEAESSDTIVINANIKDTTLYSFVASLKYDEMFLKK